MIQWLADVKNFTSLRLKNINPIHHRFLPYPHCSSLWSLYHPDSGLFWHQSLCFHFQKNWLWPREIDSSVTPIICWTSCRPATSETGDVVCWDQQKQQDRHFANINLQISQKAAEGEKRLQAKKPGLSSKSPDVYNDVMVWLYSGGKATGSQQVCKNMLRTSSSTSCKPELELQYLGGTVVRDICESTSYYKLTSSSLLISSKKWEISHIGNE